MPATSDTSAVTLEAGSKKATTSDARSRPIVSALRRLPPSAVRAIAATGEPAANQSQQPAHRRARCEGFAEASHGVDDRLMVAGCQRRADLLRMFARRLLRR